jgi:hypothetical protein
MLCSATAADGTVSCCSDHAVVVQLILLIDKRTTPANNTNSTIRLSCCTAGHKLTTTLTMNNSRNDS